MGDLRIELQAPVVLSNIRFNTDTLRFVYTNFKSLTFIKKR